MSEQNNNVDNEVLKIIKRFITEYDKREKSKVRISRIGALIKISFITIFVISLLMFYVPFLAKFHSMDNHKQFPKALLVQ